METCDSQTVILDLRPTGKGRKLAWHGAKYNDAENADAAEFAAGGDMPTVFAGGLSHGQTACEPASRGVVKHEVYAIIAIGDYSPQYLAKARGTSAGRN